MFIHQCVKTWEQHCNWQSLSIKFCLYFKPINLILIRLITTLKITTAWTIISLCFLCVRWIFKTSWKRHHEINDPAFECTRFNYSAASFFGFGLTFAPAESAKCGSQQLSGQLGDVVPSLSFVPGLPQLPAGTTPKGLTRKVHSIGPGREMKSTIFN